MSDTIIAAIIAAVGTICGVTLKILYDAFPRKTGLGRLSGEWHCNKTRNEGSHQTSDLLTITSLEGSIVKGNLQRVTRSVRDDKAGATVRSYKVLGHYSNDLLALVIFDADPKEARSFVALLKPNSSDSMIGATIWMSAISTDFELRHQEVWTRR